MRGFRAAVVFALLVALSVTLAPAIGATLKRPKEGRYFGVNEKVEARVWVDIRNTKPFRAFVVDKFEALESGDPFTAWIVQTTCADGSSQPFNVSAAPKDLRISNKTGRFSHEVTLDQPIGSSGNMVDHIKITGKINGARANGTVAFDRTVNDPSGSNFFKSCSTGGPLAWSARLER